MTAPLPRRLYRVSWRAALGWPNPADRRDTARNFTTAEAAGRQVAIIREMPSHLELQAVHVCECSWSEMDPATLPVPEREEDEDAASQLVD